MRLLSAGTAALTAAAVSLWPTAILMPADGRTLADLRSGAVSSTILAGVLWAVAELRRRDRCARERERALIRVIDRMDSRPSGPFSAVR